MRSASSEGSANGTNAVPLPASGSAGVPIVTARAAMAHVSPVFGASDGYAEQIPEAVSPTASPGWASCTGTCNERGVFGNAPYAAAP